MSDGKNQNPPDDFNLDFGSFDEPSEAALGAVPSDGAPPGMDDTDFGFGEPGVPGMPDDDFVFDDMPQAPGGSDDDFGAVQDDFGDAVADDTGKDAFDFADETQAEDSAYGVADENEFGEEAHDDEYGVEFAEDAAEGAVDAVDAPEVSKADAAKHDLISKLILPVGAVIGAGAVAFIGWPMFSGLLGAGGSSAPPQQATFTPTAQAPALPPAAAPALPSGQPAALPAPAVTAPTLPAPAAPAVPVAPAAPALPVPASGAPGLPAPGVSVTTPSAELAAAPAGAPATGFNRPETASQEPTAPVAPTALSSGIEAALNNLVIELRTLNNKVDDFDERLTTTRSDVFERIGRTEGKLEGIEEKLVDLEQRLAAIEADKTAPEGGGTASEGARAVPIPERKPAPPATPRQEAKAPPAPKVIKGHMLRGVSRDAALVETPSGLVRVAIGQSLGDAGVAKEIRREGGSWVLVTTEGLVRP